MSMFPASVLIVDDQPDNLRVLSTILRNQGYKVRQAVSGEMALETVRSQLPNIILLDILMPHMDGYEVCARLRASDATREIPVIFLSALNDAADKAKAFETGGVDYITKPFQEEEVLVRIHHQLTIQQQRQQLLEQNLQLQREIQERQLLGIVINNIRQSLQLHQILAVAVEEVRQLLQVSRVVIYQFHADWSAEIVAESVYSESLSLREERFDDERFKAYWLQLAPQLHQPFGQCWQMHEVPPDYQALLTHWQVQGRLVAPIRVSDAVWGLLVAHECFTSRTWESWEIEFFHQLSEQLAIAIQQSNLYHQVQRLNATLERQVHTRTLELKTALDFENTLKRITDKVRDSLDETQILQTAVEELAKAIEAERCDTAILTPDRQALVIRHQYREPSQPSTQGQELSITDYPDIYDQLQRGLDFAFCQLDPHSSRNHAAVLACPIMDEHDLLGDLWLFKPTPSSFGDQEIHLVRQVANQCAIALRQARLYQAAHAQLRELQRLNQLKDDFLSTVSHELRAPIANIRMVIRLLMAATNQGQNLLAQVTDEPENRVTQYLNILQDECERELQLVQDLLDMQHLSAGTRPLILATLHLRDWILHVIEPFSIRTQSQHQTLEVNLAEDLPLLTTDLSSLSRILIELLNNACKYTPAGQTIRVTAQLRATTHPTVDIEVCNSGIEIPSEELPRIFDKFYRIPGNDPWQHGGTGLGLALVKKLVEHLQGQINVRSDSDWTCFTVTLPLVIVAD